jgi:DNA-binding NarL/FixJ family response regulator
MRVYWERIGVLGPIYRLAGNGFNDREIANKLNLAENKVQGCTSWMLHSFRMPNRMELARDAFSTEPPRSRHN